MDRHIGSSEQPTIDILHMLGQLTESRYLKLSHNHPINYTTNILPHTPHTKHAHYPLQTCLRVDDNALLYDNIFPDDDRMYDS